MPINPHLIPRRAGDPGSAQRTVDLDRRLRQIEARAGVIGQGATVTGAVFTTSDTGARVSVQGQGGALNGGQPGFYVTDATPSVVISITAAAGIALTGTGGLTVSDGSGGTAVSIVSGVGMTLAAGTSGLNQVSWKSGAITTGTVYSYRNSGQNIIELTAGFPGPGLTIVDTGVEQRRVGHEWLCCLGSESADITARSLRDPQRRDRGPSRSRVLRLERSGETRYRLRHRTSRGAISAACKRVRVQTGRQERTSPRTQREG